MRYLFAVSVGPVQSFIAAARKVRDLHAGSWILSETAKAAAKRLVEAHGELVFPFAGGDLEPRAAFTASNKILAVVESESPAELAVAAREAARLRLIGLCGELRDHPHHDAARLLEHVDELLEFYAAWAPFPEGGDYKALYAEVEALLNARKMTRAFPQHVGKPGLLKSSLDGMRESILPNKKTRATDTRVDPDEELDGTGFLKRFVRLNDDLRFDSVRDLARKPYGDNAKRGDDFYYAILVADGDSMGEAISGMDRIQQQSFSGRLSQFAAALRNRLDDDLECMTVFAAGDELIAMVPLHRLVQAAKTVHDTFAEIVCTDGAPFTISSGIAIVHEMEPLDGAREMAKKAKRDAKDLNGKNALCIIEVPRSGAPVSVAGKWDWMLPALRAVVSAYAEKTLSYGFGHELWDLLIRTPDELEDALPKLALALARHKEEQAAARLVESNADRLNDLLGVMLVARKMARAGEATKR